MFSENFNVLKYQNMWRGYQNRKEANNSILMPRESILERFRVKGSKILARVAANAKLTQTQYYTLVAMAQYEPLIEAAELDVELDLEVPALILCGELLDDGKEICNLDAEGFLDHFLWALECCHNYDDFLADMENIDLKRRLRQIGNLAWRFQKMVPRAFDNGFEFTPVDNLNPLRWRVYAPVVVKPDAPGDDYGFLEGNAEYCPTNRACLEFWMDEPGLDALEKFMAETPTTMVVDFMDDFGAYDRATDYGADHGYEFMENIPKQELDVFLDEELEKYREQLEDEFGRPCQLVVEGRCDVRKI